MNFSRFLIAITAVAIGLLIVSSTGAAHIITPVPSTYPFIRAKAVLSYPAGASSIYYEGTAGDAGAPSSTEQATITLTVTGDGDPVQSRTPFDVVIVIDCSGSMDWNDQNGIRGQASQRFVNRYMQYPDRGAGVFFEDSSVAFLVNGHHLTTTKHYCSARHAHGECPTQGCFQDLGNDVRNVYDGGGTCFYNPLRIAVDELTGYHDQPNSYGARDNEKVIIFMTDGDDNHGSWPGSCNYAQQVYRARDYRAPNGPHTNHGIRIYTIGFGSPDSYSLQQIASVTGGQYYYISSVNQIDRVYDDIANQFSIREAGYIHDANHWIQFTMWDYIHYVPGSMVSSTPLAAGYPQKNADGSTTLRWYKDVLKIGERWEATFKITATKEGSVRVDKPQPHTQVSYKKYNPATRQFDIDGVAPFDVLYVSVVIPSIPGVVVPPYVVTPGAPPPPPGMPVLAQQPILAEIGVANPLITPLVNPVMVGLTQPTLVMQSVVQMVMQTVTMPNFIGILLGIGIMERVKQKRKLKAMGMMVRARSERPKLIFGE